MLFVLGCGYVGSVFLKKRPLDRSQFIASTTSPNKVEELGQIAHDVVVLKSDDKVSLKQTLDRCDILTVFVAPNKDADYKKVYLETAFNLKNILLDRKKKLYVLCASSTFVYEGLQKEATEEDALVSTHPKAQILSQMEQVLMSCKNDLVDTCILRLGGIYGPQRDLGQRARVLSGKMLAGTGKEPTNNIHIDDVANFCWYCIDHRLSGIYNVVNDDHPSREKLYGNLCNQMQIKPPSWNPSEKPEHGCGCIVSNQKITSTGFIFSHRSIND